MDGLFEFNHAAEDPVTQPVTGNGPGKAFYHVEPRGAGGRKVHYEKPVLGLAEAMAALDAMLKEAAREPERPLAFAVMDDNGELLAFARMDRGLPPRWGNAMKKAYTAVRYRDDTVNVAERMKATGRSLLEFNDPNLVALQGGVVVKRPSDGAVLGGIGVSGRRSDEDEVIAKIGLAAMGLDKE